MVEKFAFVSVPFCRGSEEFVTKTFRTTGRVNLSKWDTLLWKNTFLSVPIRIPNRSMSLEMRPFAKVSSEEKKSSYLYVIFVPIFNRELEKVFDEDIPLRSSYLNTKGIELFKSGDKQTFFLTIVYFTPVPKGISCRINLVTAVLEIEGVIWTESDIEEQLPPPFGLLTLREIPDACLAPFQTSIDGITIIGSFKYRIPNISSDFLQKLWIKRPQSKRISSFEMVPFRAH